MGPKVGQGHMDPWDGIGLLWTERMGNLYSLNRVPLLLDLRVHSHEPLTTFMKVPATADPA